MPQQEPVEIAGGWDDLGRARSGSQAAWKALFERYSPRLLRMAALITGSTDTARDCVQETFVRVLRSEVRHQSGTLRAYLSTITYRLALKESARLRRLTPSGAIDAASSGPSPLDRAIADDRQREVARVLLRLPSHHREILVLRFHGEHTYEEIAEIAGLPLGTVKSRLFNALKAARADMKTRGIV